MVRSTAGIPGDAGPVAVVTGGSRGIGRALAIALAAHGYSVVVVGRTQDRLSETLQRVREAGSGGHSALQLDVADPDDMRFLADHCRDQHGRADVLVASAGIGQTEPGRLPPPTRDLPLEEWNAVLGINLYGVIQSNLALFPLMRDAGHGDIVNIGSSTTPNGLRGTPLAPAYCASKFAMAAFSRDFAAEAAAHGVRVTNVYPGSVETPLIAGTMLDGPFGGRISEQSFAKAVLAMIDIADDSLLDDPHLLPMPRRRQPT